MPILSAEALERVIIKAVFDDVVRQDGAYLHDQVNAAIERHRAALLEALRLLEEELPALIQQRNDALAALMDRSLSPTLKSAMSERAEELVAAYEQKLIHKQQLLAAIDTLAANARSVLAVLTAPNLDPNRWREPEVFAALRRALAILVRKAVVSSGSTRSSFVVSLSVATDPIGMPDSGRVMNLANTRAHVSFRSRLIITEPVFVKT